MRRLALVLPLLLLVPQLSQAQNRYARTPGDTLRYQERTDVDVQVQTPQGPIAVAVNSSAGVEISFVTPDTLRAWFTDLSVSSETPMGTQRPSTERVLNAPFTVYFSPRGEVETTSAPAVPDELRGISDVRRQFDDFFLVLPEEELRVGLSWEYEAAVDKTEEEGRYAFTKTGTLTVTGDTTVAGIDGFRIEGDLASTLSVTMTNAAQGVTVNNEFSGVERNVIVFAPEEGMLLSRDRKADLAGTTTYEGGPMPMSMEQKIAYDSRLQLQP